LREVTTRKDDSTIKSALLLVVPRYYPQSHLPRDKPWSQSEFPTQINGPLATFKLV
jgi:hypothetical protein